MNRGDEVVAARTCSVRRKNRGIPSSQGRLSGFPSNEIGDRGTGGVPSALRLDWLLYCHRSSRLARSRNPATKSDGLSHGPGGSGNVRLSNVGRNQCTQRLRRRHHLTRHISNISKRSSPRRRPAATRQCDLHGQRRRQSSGGNGNKQHDMQQEQLPDGQHLR
jgi:hypothetical protein